MVYHQVFITESVNHDRTGKKMVALLSWIWNVTHEYFEQLFLFEHDANYMCAIIFYRCINTWYLVRIFWLSPCVLFLYVLRFYKKNYSYIRNTQADNSLAYSYRTPANIAVLNIVITSSFIYLYTHWTLRSHFVFESTNRIHCYFDYSNTVFLLFEYFFFIWTAL